MTSALYVTTKQFCKRAWLGALLAVGLLVMGPMSERVVWLLEGLNLTYSNADFIGGHFVYLGTSWVLFLAVSLHAFAGLQQTCLKLPISSRVIATWLMLAMVGLVVLLQLVTNGVYHMLFFDDQRFVYYWTVLGPLLFITTLIFVGQATFWSMHSPSFTRLIFGIGLIVAMFLWFSLRYYPNGFNAEIVPWNHVTLSEFVTMQLLCLASWVQGTRAFEQVRSGSTAPSRFWSEMVSWWNNLRTGPNPDIALGPVSLRSSLSLLHWRDSCHRTVVVGSVGFGITVLIINLMFGTQLGVSGSGKGDAVHFYRTTIEVTFEISCIAAVVFPVLLTKGIRGTGTTSMKPFLAMTPLSDRDFSAVLFWNMAKTLGYTFLMIQLGLILSYAVMALFTGSDIFREELISRHVFGWISYVASGTVLWFWVISANLVSITWTGRSSFYYKMIGGAIVGYLFFVLFDESIRWYFNWNGVLRWMCMALLYLILAGTVTAYVVARRKNLIGSLVVRNAMLFWFVSVIGLSLFIWLQDQDFRLWDKLFIGSAVMTMNALIIAPFATIPLAISWNRHR